MKYTLSFATFLMAGIMTLASAQTQSWQGMHKVPASQAESNFANPPQEFASHVIWGWEGDMDLATIQHDLDSIKTKGFRSVIFEAGYSDSYEYLSEGWFENIRRGVLEAKKRGLKVWIIDEGKYPSGFAGGKFSKERPDLRMKAVVPVDTVFSGVGNIILGAQADPKAISAVAVSRSGAPNRTVEIKDGKFTFFSGLDEWDIIFAGTDFRTSQTMAVNNPRKRKDMSNSICDYLDPAATRQFIEWTHEQYKKYIGDEFGKTVLGFRGDEPGYQFNPWTPAMVEEFMNRKGYDPRPYLASLLTRNLTTTEKRFKADYWDVWSDLFAINYFKPQSDWCEENGLAHITHLDKDDSMPQCVRMGGDLFRVMSNVQVPGIDVIWDQIWPGTTNDYPKYVTSASHVYGKPRSFSESFAAFYTSPSMEQAKFVVDYQIVRGINFFEYMFWMAGSKHRNWMTDPGMKDFNDYTNRATYLMSLGVPGAQVAVYYPLSTMWLGNTAIDADLQALSHTLLEHQVDFDWVDDDAFTTALEVKPGYFLNKSGQKYRTLIIPSCDAMPVKAWEQVEKFADEGGKVIFWGHRPSQLTGQSFMKPLPSRDLVKNCFDHAGNAWNPALAAALPQPEFVAEGTSTASIRYTRRILPDAEVYFVFNEGEQSVDFTAQFATTGITREWDAASGKTLVLDADKVNGKTRVKMTLGKWESKIIVIEKGKKEYNIKKYGVKADGTSQTRTLQALIDRVYADGGGTIVVPAGTYMSGALFFPHGVNLRIDKRGVLKSVADDDEFPVIKTRFEGNEKDWKCAFLNFTDSKGVQVYGQGTIDGNGPEWNRMVGRSGYSRRPRLVNFTRCDGGSIKGLNLHNQALWCLHVLYCDEFTIDGLHIAAIEYTPSSDGIDLDSSNDILLANTYIYCHDDCLSIKSGKDTEGRRIGRPAENIRVENCHFAYGHGGVDIGSEVSGSVRNVHAINCTFDDGNWGSIRIKSQPARGGVIENITFENFTVKGSSTIIDVNLDWTGGNKSEVPGYSDPVTQLRNIRIINCHGFGERLGQIRGFDCDPFKSDAFYFENNSFEVQSGMNIKNTENVDFNGLEAKVAEGPVFFKDGEFTPKPLVHRGSMNNLPQEGTRPLKK